MPAGRNAAGFISATDRAISATTISRDATDTGRIPAGNDGTKSVVVSENYRFHLLLNIEEIKKGQPIKKLSLKNSLEQI